jgi:hypothetical protein
VRAEALRIGHGGTVLAAQVRGAAVASDPARAQALARAALDQLDRGLRSTALLPAEPWLLVTRALDAAGDPEAGAVLKRGVDWLHRTAVEQVPEPFRASFLQRNPVNRALVALANGRRL